jgi:ectoine hydroxylase-related dioxygenase (phytanoyl-CoA dioxygenase family)
MSYFNVWTTLLPLTADVFILKATQCGRMYWSSTMLISHSNSGASRAMTSESKAQINSIEEALAHLGVNQTTLSEKEKHELDERGYLVLKNVIDESELAQMLYAFEEVNAAQRQSDGKQQSGTRHINDLVNEGDLFERAYTHPRLLAAVYHVLGRPFRLGQLNGRDPLPGYGQQGMHADWGYRESHDPFQIVTSIWILDGFTEKNGATRVVPGTHRMKSPPKAMADPASRHPDQISVIAGAGSLLIFNGHLWHSGTRNNSDSSRRVLQCSFVGRESQNFISSKYEVPETLSPAARYILGI